MKNVSANIILVGIFLLGFTVRLVGISVFPPSLNWDEASLGYNAYSLLSTGHDEWGQSFPFSFRAFGDYKLPVTVYLIVPFIRLLGPGIPAVRLPSAVFGSLLILTTYVWTYRLFGRKNLALFSAFLIAFQPWTWFFSRIALEANISLTLLSLAGVLFMSGRIPVSVLFFALSAWTYNSARGFVPLLLLALTFIHLSRIKTFFSGSNLASRLSLALSGILLAGVICQLFTSAGQARLQWMTLIDSGAVSRIESLRQNSSLPSSLIPVFYNRPVFFTFSAITNYFRHFSFPFLFLSGGSHYQFSIPGYGLFSPVLAPLFYSGLLLLFFNRHLPRRRFLLVWFIFSLIPGSIVRDAPHALRAVPFIPLAVTLIVAGWREIVRVFRLPRSSLAGIILLIVVFSLPYLISLPGYSREYSWSWQYGYRGLVSYLRSNYSEYDRVVITKKYGEPHIFILYYWPWQPQAYQQDRNLSRYFRSDWYWVDSFAGFEFVNDWEMEEKVAGLNPDENVLIAAGPEMLLPATRLDQINFLNGEPAYIIYSK